jgi:hypothetical protein
MPGVDGLRRPAIAYGTALPLACAITNVLVKTALMQWHLIELPEFSREQTGERVVVGNACQPGFGEWRRVVRETRGAQAGDDAKGEVERANEHARGKTHAARWDAEVGDKPKSFCRERRSNKGDEIFEIRLGEAIEEEVSNDKVVGSVRREGERAAVVRSQPRGTAPATLPQELKHGSAGVYSVDVDARVRGHEGCEKATISVSDGESSLLIKQSGKEMQAAALQ